MAEPLGPLERPTPGAGRALGALAALIGYACWKPATGVTDWVAACWLPSYQHQFLARGLPGELLPGDQVHSAQIEHVAAVVLALVAVTAFALISATYLRARHRRPTAAAALYGILVLLSIAPFSFVQAAAEIGRFDHINWLLAAAAAVAASTRRWAWLVAPIVAVMLLVHEAALLLVLPALFAGWLVLVPRSRTRDLAIAAAAVSAIVTTTVVSAAGGARVPATELLVQFENRAADFAVPQGFAEVYASSPARALEITAARWNLKTVRNLALLLLLLSPLLWLLWRGWRAVIGGERRALLLPASALAGLPMFALGFDFFRWLGGLLLAQWVLLLVYAHARDRHAELAAACALRPAALALAALACLYTGPIGVTAPFDHRLVLLRW